MQYKQGYDKRSIPDHNDESLKTKTNKLFGI